MSVPPEQRLIYHITDVKNLSGILAEGGLHSDSRMAQKNPTVIGYLHIKERRLKEIHVPCCDNRFVGEFVPFYFCPRSPMLYTINRGNNGMPAGCQETIVHLVSTVGTGIGLKKVWAVSDGNAGAWHTLFFGTLTAIDALDWDAIRATNWRGKTHQKSAEFLVADFFPWAAIHRIGCYHQKIVSQVKKLLQSKLHQPVVECK